MQSRTSKQKLSNVGSGLVSLVVTGLALAVLLPGAWQSVAQASPRIEHAKIEETGRPSIRVDADGAGILDNWSDTSLHLTPEQKAKLARHEAIEERNLARQLELDRDLVERLLRHASPEERRFLEAFLRRYTRQARQLLRLHILRENQSGTPSTFVIPRFVI